jgi:hypothetical protein
MEVVIVGNGLGNMNCLLAACARYISVGHTQSLNGETWYPFINVIFEASDLLMIGPLLRRMRECEVLPELHIWDTQTESPEIVVIFRIKNPVRELLSEILGGPNDPIARRLSKLRFNEVLTTGEASVPAGAVTGFIAHYADTHKALVVVSEAGDIGQNDILPIQIFVVQDIIRSKPDI